MRIIAGSLRGRRLISPPGEAVRPTPDRVRESVFNILGQWLDGMDFLDLFSGSGAMGLEAASRGARRVVLVERDPLACETVEHNIASLGLAGVVDLVRGDVLESLASLGRGGSTFDVVFADPPYSELPSTLEAVLAALAGGSLVAPDGIVVLQARRGRDLPRHPAFAARAPRHYGITSILIHDRQT